MKIICIGRNYREHAAELNNPVPERPVFFFKPDTALVPKNQPVFYPEFTQDLQYECEIVVKINRLGKSIPEKFAHKYYSEIAIGLDLTARDLQAEAKSRGLPWSLAKGFDYSAPISKYIAVDELKDVNDLHFSLKKNEEVVQSASTAEMIFSIDRLIAYLSQFMTLKTGDLIFTGTPSGVSSLKIGDKLEAFIEDRLMLTCNIR